MKKIKIEYWVLGLGALVFLVGALIYPLRDYLGRVDGVFLESFSAFSHALFFVLAWGFPYISKYSIIWGGVIITIIITWFEYMQDDYLAYFIDYLPQIVINYARNGSFDQQDVNAGYLGAILAVFIGIIVASYRVRMEKPATEKMLSD